MSSFGQEEEVQEACYWYCSCLKQREEKGVTLKPQSLKKMEVGLGQVMEAGQYLSEGLSIRKKALF